jgi:hypothetical protein
MKLSLILETVEDQIDHISQRDKLPTSEIVNICKQAHPRYWKWVLIQWYKDNIRLPEDNHRVNETLRNFDTVKSRLRVKDINKYSKLSEIEKVVNPLLGIKSSNKVVDINLPGVEVVDVNGPFTTVKVSNVDSLMDLGEGTKWCTRRSYPECQAGHYLDMHGFVFIILQDGRPVIQYTPDFDQVMDVNNDPVVDEKLLSLIPKPSFDSGARTLYSYALKVIKGRWPEAEPYIMRNPERAYCYNAFVNGFLK